MHVSILGVSLQKMFARAVSVLVTLILSSVFGSIVGVGMVALSKTKFGKFVEIPYGPYICMGCLAWMFYGPELVSWYLNLLGGRG